MVVQPLLRNTTTIGVLILVLVDDGMVGAMKYEATIKMSLNPCFGG